MIENIIYLLIGALIAVIGQNVRIKKLKVICKIQKNSLANLRFQLKESEREVEATKQILRYRNETIDMMNEANKKHIEEKKELADALENNKKLLIQKNLNAKNNKKTNSEVL